MRIINDVSVTNFGMAMRIQKTAAPELRKLPAEVIDNIAETAKKLENTRYFNVDIGADLRCKITSPKDAYFGIFTGDKFKKIERGEQDNIIILSGASGHSGAYGVAKYSDLNNYEISNYNVWGNYNKELNTIYDLKAISDVVLELDKAAAKHAESLYAAEQNKIAAQQVVDAKVNNLLDKIGV